MKVYDIALTLVRVLVVVDVIRELASLISDIIGAAVMSGTLLWSSSPEAHELVGGVEARALTLGQLAAVTFAIIVDLSIFAAAPRIARFASKFALPETDSSIASLKS